MYAAVVNKMTERYPLFIELGNEDKDKGNAHDKERLTDKRMIILLNQRLRNALKGKAMIGEFVFITKSI